MNPSRMLGTLAVCAVFTATTVVTAVQSPQTAVKPPVLGETARDFSLNRMDGQTVSLSSLRRAGPVVVLMLRGWVGYQCPICVRQVGGFLSQAAAFKTAGASIVMIYPGAATSVRQYASDFITGKTLPDNIHFVTDPDLGTVNQYGLRWDAPNETAYPSTFVIDRDGVVRFVKISRAHGDRSAAPEVIQVLNSLAAAEHPALGVVRQFTDATRRGDTSVMRSLMADQYFEVSPVGEVDLRDKVLGFFAKDVFKAENAPASVTVGEAHVVERPGLAVVTTKDTYAMETPGGKVERSMRTTTVLVQDGGRWVILSRQYTGIRQSR